MNLGDSENPITERIALYANTDPVKVATSFAKKNNLDDHVRDNLANLLKEQLAKILPGVQEEDEEEQLRE